MVLILSFYISGPWTNSLLDHKSHTMWHLMVIITLKKALNRYNIFLLDQRCWEYFWIDNTESQKFWWNSHRCPYSISQLDWHQVVSISFHFYLSHPKLCRIMYTTAGASLTVGRLSTPHFQLTTSHILTFNFLWNVLTDIP